MGLELCGSLALWYGPIPKDQKKHKDSTNEGFRRLFTRGLLSSRVDI